MITVEDLCEEVGDQDISLWSVGEYKIENQGLFSRDIQNHRSLC
jgi:hypothetical protein